MSNKTLLQIIKHNRQNPLDFITKVHLTSNEKLKVIMNRELGENLGSHGGVDDDVFLLGCDAV
jgi:hypothetical protein